MSQRSPATRANRHHQGGLDNHPDSGVETEHGPHLGNYVIVTPGELRDRPQLEAPNTTFEMTDADHDRFLASIELPSREELDNGPIPPPPPGHDTWPAWASWRWPTLPVITFPADD